MKGIFIVIDGTDGAGKKTQSQKLLERLESEGYITAVADFPQYGQKSAGMVENYLNGKYGNAASVDPRIASVFYAVDRYDASFDIRKSLEEGKVLISNRYVSANMGHQAGKIADPAKRKQMIEWLKDLEYGLFKLPVPDLTIILYVEPKIAQQLVDRKAAREYIGGKKRDIHERSLRHLIAAAESYKEI
ncbi:MAG: thymidylate kinase, partial [Candidatus Kerfeldbacteria bacterium]|nr:thymidylate kinase [Candidatus Kerfeldbacteria bacterium]